MNFETSLEPSSPIIEMLKPKPRGLDISWRTDVTSKQDRYDKPIRGLHFNP